MLVGIPMVVVLGAWFAPATENWLHLRATVLPDYLSNTLVLIIATGSSAGILGVATAWFVATTDFPLRRLLSWALVLPLAAPAYITAYVYTDLLEYAGPVQTFTRDTLGWSGGGFPRIRSLPGAAFVLAFALYPYVYLLCRSVFSTQASVLFDGARVLGSSPLRAFVRVALPVARPAVAGGVALVMMETAADYGVVEFFGVPTFTTGLFRAWFAMGDQQTALQLAAGLFALSMALVVFERAARRGRVHNPVGRAGPTRPRALSGLRGILVTTLCVLPVVIGFVLPFGVVARYAFTVGDPLFERSFLGFALNSFSVAAAGALIATALALWLAYSERLYPMRTVRASIRFATLGYALPGAMIALGALVPLAGIDRLLAGWVNANFDMRIGLLLTGSTAALVFVYVVRFLTSAYNACHGGLEQIHRRLDDAGRTLGASPGRLLREVHAPLLGPAVGSALLLVFIDIVKELPATLLLRPFNFETLATRAYRLASDERLAEASTAALCLVMLGILPALLLGVRRRAPGVIAGQSGQPDTLHSGTGQRGADA